MKKLPTLTSSLALSALLLTSQAQTPATSHDNPTPAKPTKTADHRAATYQGPKVVSDSKALGKKMVQKSKPADMRTRVSDMPVKK
jgi:hypothetical protein